MRRPRSLEALSFRGALLILMLHALDDAVLHRQPGVELGQHALAALAALLVGGLALVSWSSLRPGARAGVAVSLGLLGLANGAMHVAHVRADAVAGSDVTGVLAAIAGLALVGLGAAVPFVHRGERAPSARTRWRNRALALPTCILALVLLVAPVGMAIVDSHKWREPIPATPAGYEDGTFAASDRSSSTPKTATSRSSARWTTYTSASSAAT